MKLGERQREIIGRFLGHSDDDGWFGFKRARTESGDWPGMKSLVARGLMETKQHEKWGDCRKARITQKGREAYSA